MRTGLSRILGWLGSQSATAAILIFSISNKIIFVLLTSTVGRDKILQLSVTENIISGHGMGVFKYYTQDIYTPVAAYDLVSLVILLIIQIAQIVKNRSHINPSFKLFILSGTAVSVTIILSLLYLSLTHSNNVRPFILWSFVNDERYFGFIYLFLQIAFLRWIFFTKEKRGLFKKVITSFLSLRLSIECCHGLYYNVKAIFNYKEVELFQNHDEDYRAFDAICGSIKREKSER